MFNAKMSQASTLRKIVDSIKDLVSQVNIDANSNGLTLQAMDSAHVSLVSLLLSESGFAEYRCDKNISLGINLVEFSKILKMSSGDDEVTLKCDSSTSYLSILLENEKTGRSSEFNLNLLSLESESLGIPETDYPTSITINSSEFFKICKEVTTVSDTLQIQIADENSALLSFSGKSGNGKIKLKSNLDEKGADTIIIKCTEEVNSRYGLSYLNNFSKASSLSDLVEVNLSTQYPMMIHYKLEDMGYIKFYLAPKMDDEN